MTEKTGSPDVPEDSPKLPEENAEDTSSSPDAPEGEQLPSDSESAPTKPPEDESAPQGTLDSGAVESTSPDDAADSHGDAPNPPQGEEQQPTAPPLPLDGAAGPRGLKAGQAAERFRTRRRSAQRPLIKLCPEHKDERAYGARRPAA
jgi:hypothetical protein